MTEFQKERKVDLKLLLSSTMCFQLCKIFIKNWVISTGKPQKPPNICTLLGHCFQAENDFLATFCLLNNNLGIQKNYGES